MKWVRAVLNRVAFIGAVLLVPAFVAFTLANGAGSGALLLGSLAGACSWRRPVARRNAAQAARPEGTREQDSYAGGGLSL
jgi:hypothetical protein